MIAHPWLPSLLFACLAASVAPAAEVANRGEDFLINGKPTLEGRKWRGMSVEGLLPNFAHGAGHL